jgi:hypothetical protein
MQFSKNLKSILSPFSVKKYALYCLVNVYESFYWLDIFQINSHVPMIYYEPYYIKKSYIFNTKLYYHF